MVSTIRRQSASGMRRALSAALGGAITGGPCGVLVAAVDLPALRQGLWKFTRTVGGKTIESSKCVDPTEDTKRQNAKLEKMGCTVSPVRQSRSTYTLESTCSTRGINSQTTSVLTVESDSAYRLEVTGTIDGEPTRETLVAKRTGECAR